MSCAARTCHGCLMKYSQQLTRLVFFIITLCVTKRFFRVIFILPLWSSGRHMACEDIVRIVTECVFFDLW